MEERHKKILQRNRTNLVRDLDPSDLYDGLLEKGVFTQDMIDEIKVRRLCGSRHRSSGSFSVVGGELSVIPVTPLVIASGLWDQA